MSLRGNLRAIPAVFRVSFAESVAYRAEMFVWILATTMPLIMLALWSAVAREAPVGRFGQQEFTAYFLSTFIVRQLTGSWAAWEMNFEVRQGTLAMRLLRPWPAVWSYALENLAAVPMRLIVSLPVAGIALATVGSHFLPRDPVIWIIWCFSMLGGWLVTFLTNILIGCLSLFLESSTKLMDAWLAAFMVFSGYLIPIETFPPGLRRVVEWLPFRFQIGFPVELMTHSHGRLEAFELLVRCWGWVALLLFGAVSLWRAGIRRFAAYGG